MKYYKNVGGETLEAHSEQIRLDDYLIKPQKEIGQIKSNPLLSEISPPPLGIDPDKTPIGTSAISEPYIDPKPPKTTDTTIQGNLYPDCYRKWEEYLSVVKFGSNEEMEKAKNEFMTKCMSTSTIGASQIVEPEVVIPIKDTTSETSAGSTTNNVVLPNLGAFLGSLTGGAGGGAGAIEETATIEKKKPFPYWLIVVAVVGGYLIFRKK
jgi:hypothetical protein